MKILILLLAVPMFAQTLATISETAFKQAQQGALFTGKIELQPARGCRLTRGGESFSFTRRVYCVGVPAPGAPVGDCDVLSAAGVVNIQLVPTGSGTIPVGCYYTAKYTPTKGDVDTETWVIPAAQTYQIKDVRTTIVPTPSSIVRLSQIIDTTSGTGCLQKNSDGTVTPTGVACGTGTGGGGLPPTNATWSTVTGTWSTNNRTWASQ